MGAAAPEGTLKHKNTDNTVESRQPMVVNDSSHQQDIVQADLMGQYDFSQNRHVDLKSKQDTSVNNTEYLNTQDKQQNSKGNKAKKYDQS